MTRFNNPNRHAYAGNVLAKSVPFQYGLHRVDLGDDDALDLGFLLLNFGEGFN